MWPVLFHIGSYPVPGFGMAAVFGLLLALVVQRREGARLGYDPAKIDELILTTILCSWVGARAMYVIQNPEHEGGIWGAIKDTGGYVFYGGVLAGVPAGYLLARRAKVSPGRLLDIITPGMTLGLVFGRVGCTLAGCDYGRPAGAAAWWTLTFTDPKTLVPADLRGIPLLPSQPLMALGLLASFMIIYPLRKRLTPWPGAVLLLYLIVEPATRFLIEFTRGDADRGIYGPLSASQWIAAAMVPAGAIGLWLLTRRPPTPSPAEEAHAQGLRSEAD